MFKKEFMKEAFDQARMAFLSNEVPVGAVIVKNDKIIAKSHNMKVGTNNIMNHAEILSILSAIDKIGDWRLNECEMYITLEPCPMCAGAILNSRLKKIYIGAKSNIDINSSVIKSILQNREYNHFVEIEYINDKSSSKILSDFFSEKR